MKLIDLVEAHNGNIEFDVKSVSEAGDTDVVSFDSSEYAAIKDDILNSDVGKFSVTVSNNVPPKAKIVVTLKIKAEQPAETEKPAESTQEPNEEHQEEPQVESTQGE